MIPQKRRGNLRDAKGAYCLYTSPHHLGIHSVHISLCILNDAVEARCIDLRKYTKWSAKISFSHLGCMVLRNRKIGGSYEDFWEELARGVQLDANGRLEFLTQHIVSFPIVLSSRGYKSYFLHQASNYVNEKEKWLMDFISEADHPFTLEISIQRRETDSFRHTCQIPGHQFREQFIRCCLGGFGDSAEDDEGDTKRVPLNPKDVTNHEITLVFTEIIKGLVYDENTDKFIVKEVELLKLREHLHTSVDHRTDRLIKDKYNEEDLTKWLRKTVATNIAREEEDEKLRVIRDAQLIEEERLFKEREIKIKKQQLEQQQMFERLLAERERKRQSEFLGDGTNSSVESSIEGVIITAGEQDATRDAGTMEENYRGGVQHSYYWKQSGRYFHRSTNININTTTEEGGERDDDIDQDDDAASATLLLLPPFVPTRQDVAIVLLDIIASIEHDQHPHYGTDAAVDADTGAVPSAVESASVSVPEAEEESFSVITKSSSLAAVAAARGAMRGARSSSSRKVLSFRTPHDQLFGEELQPQKEEEGENLILPTVHDADGVTDANDNAGDDDLSFKPNAGWKVPADKEHPAAAEELHGGEETEDIAAVVTVAADHAELMEIAGEEREGMRRNVFTEDEQEELRLMSIEDSTNNNYNHDIMMVTGVGADRLPTPVAAWFEGGGEDGADDLLQAKEKGKQREDGSESTVAEAVQWHDKDKQVGLETAAAHSTSSTTAEPSNTKMTFTEEPLKDHSSESVTTDDFGIYPPRGGDIDISIIDEFTEYYLVRESLGNPADERSHSSKELIIKFLTEWSGLSSYLSLLSPMDRIELTNACYLNDIPARTITDDVAFPGELISTCFIVLNGYAEVALSSTSSHSPSKSNAPVRHKSVDEYLDFHLQSMTKGKKDHQGTTSKRDTRKRSSSSGSGGGGGISGDQSSASQLRVRRIGPACVIGVDAVLKGQNAWPCSLRTIKDQPVELLCISAEAILRLIGQAGAEVKEYINFFWAYTRLRMEATKELMFQLFPPVVDHEADTLEQALLEAVAKAPDEPMKVIDGVRLRTYQSGTELAKQGAPRQYLLLLMKGECAVIKKFDPAIVPGIIPTEIETGVKLYPGDFFFMDGESSDWVTFQRELRSTHRKPGALPRMGKRQSELMNARHEAVTDFTHKMDSSTPLPSTMLAPYGRHKYTLLATTRVQVAVVYMSEIAKNRTLFSGLLAIEEKKYIPLRQTDKDFVRKYHEARLWEQKKRSVLADVLIEQRGKRPYKPSVFALDRFGVREKEKAKVYQSDYPPAYQPVKPASLPPGPRDPSKAGAVPVPIRTAIARAAMVGGNASNGSNSVSGSTSPWSPKNKRLSPKSPGTKQYTAATTARTSKAGSSPNKGDDKGDERSITTDKSNPLQPKPPSLPQSSSSRLLRKSSQASAQLELQRQPSAPQSLTKQPSTQSMTKDFSAKSIHMSMQPSVPKLQLHQTSDSDTTTTAGNNSQSQQQHLAQQQRGGSRSATATPAAATASSRSGAPARTGSGVARFGRKVVNPTSKRHGTGADEDLNGLKQSQSARAQASTPDDSSSARRISLSLSGAAAAPPKRREEPAAATGTIVEDDSATTRKRAVVSSRRLPSAAMTARSVVDTGQKKKEEPDAEYFVSLYKRRLAQAAQRLAASQIESYDADDANTGKGKKIDYEEYKSGHEGSEKDLQDLETETPRTAASSTKEEEILEIRSLREPVEGGGGGEEEEEGGDEEEEEEEEAEEDDYYNETGGHTDSLLYR